MEIKKKITIHDIARIAKVNASTVSRVLNNDPRISEKTKEKIKKLIEKKNFIPNHAARTLAGGKTNILAVISPSFFAHFAVEALRGIERELINTYYDFQIFTTSKFTIKIGEGKRHVSEIYKRIVEQRKADGIISISINIYNKKVVNLLKTEKFPLVFIEGKEEWGHRVIVDNISGTYDATKYLISKGRKRIGFAIGHIKLVESQMDRFTGYKKALKEMDKEYDKKLFYQIKSHVDPQESKEILNYMIKQKVDAILCAAGDWLATGIMKEANKKKIKIPDDIALIGYDNLDYTESIGLTTVKQPIREMGESAFKIAIDAINNKELPQKEIIFKPELVLRNTT